MLIILEAADCSGKTTLADGLSNALGYDIVKGSSFEQATCTNEELYKGFSDMAKLDNVVFDRFIYSNEVYAQLYDDFAILSDEQRREIENDISSRALLIYLEADIDVLTSRMDKRGDDYVTVDRLQSIKDKYEESLSKVTLDHIRIDTSGLTKEEILNKVLSEVIS